MSDDVKAIRDAILADELTALGGLPVPESYEGVLVRAAEPIENCLHSTRGPGNLCRALAIRAGVHGGADLTRGSLWVEDAPRPPGRVVRTPRVGVEYAGSSARRPWRFLLAGSPWVSGPRKTPCKGSANG